MQYITEVRNFIIENFLFGDDDKLTEDASFLENGIIDSTGILELVAFLEETYGMTIEDMEMVPENFDSLRNIANFLERKLESSSIKLCAE